jgi:hypothetical protein
MDQASQAIAKFLLAIQQSQIQLGGVRDSFNRRGVKFAKVFQNLSGSPNNPSSEIIGSIMMGVAVLPYDSREFDLRTKISWDTSKWITKTTVWIDSDDDQDLVKSFPERHAETLDECLSNLQIALQELASCEDLVFNYEK